MRVSILGTGYVGLVTGACLAEVGHDVICIDLDPAKVDRIQKGFAPFHEPGLDPLIAKWVGKRLKATTDTASAVLDSDLTLIAVGTPFDGKEIDLRFIRGAARDIGLALKEKNGYHVVVVKSTVIPGTTDKVVGPILAEASGKVLGRDIGLGMNPEFLTEGEAVSDFMQPDRIVLGGADKKAQDALDELYRAFPDCERIRTGNATAEMIKYSSNALLAACISFSNELANLAADLGGIDSMEVMHGLHASRYLTAKAPDGSSVRAGIASFLSPGCGFGGSCLPKDVSALVAQGRQIGDSMNLLQSVLEINKGQPERLLSLLRKHHPDWRGLNIAVLGLSFRPDTSDMRETPSVPIIEALLKGGARVTAYDPAATEEAAKILGDRVAYASDLRGALQGAQAVILVTRWKEFEAVPDLLQGVSPAPLFIDGRRMLDKNRFARYEGIGLA